MLFHTVVWMEIATLVGLALSSPSVEPSESYHQHGLLAKREPGTESNIRCGMGYSIYQDVSKAFCEDNNHKKFTCYQDKCHIGQAHNTPKNFPYSGLKFKKCKRLHPPGPEKTVHPWGYTINQEGELIAYVQDAGTRPQDPLTDYKCEPQEQRAYCNECLAQ
ncbi:hypothetical protein Pst134EA_014972 [Puccinia striiformis f. sp. tritici]|uniref:Secreted protein n=2 Tax=Puccinia striiformis TaxID=27350 RepID=A0A0L0V4C6_9BASI|nr:hypothetical protein Pst134EA_014972 [Puccinia striiformis f. sp. tritici]KAI9606289.1 hypothetical protein KEM48_002000 [Puccinia striiformis f. sp. tritici PST-130]KNE94155.1 hypothetical protein PSTG_12486 [Puccinia striiformis f. sp. tritici PST-78]POW20698.1 hypothetical protein PSHT_03280 [Puccinia striiformis]KAH9452136.1 hypothetical protein Pst134EB_016094 [Puccinia striiformis f. sp. tritici]KAH9462883.1 hypothetical protein Pst134EA_014972 [Puccinia striiformis f. sp. tritici]